MNKPLWLGSSVILLGLVGASSLRAQELLGADDVLKQIEEKAAVGDPQDEFRKKRLAYQKQAEAFAPEVAARKWLELFKELVTLPEEGYSSENSNERNSLDAVIKALPPTSAWGEIEKQVDAMDTASDQNAKLALVILMKTLRGE